MHADAREPVATHSNPSTREALAGHRVRWLIGGDAAYAAMENAIAAASHSVRLESYLIRPDGPATVLREALVAAARRGVTIRVLLDAYGSEGLPQDFFDEIVAHGGAVRIFNPYRLLRLSFRNHRKLLVCDERDAVVGGFNIGPEYVGDGIERGWFDLGVLLTGPVAANLARSFDDMFALAPFSRTAIRAFRASQISAVDPSGRVKLLTSGPGCPHARLRRSLHQDLRNAKSVTVMAAYFLPSSRIRRALRRCARRGGRVQLLLAGRTDVALAKLAGEHLYRKLLDVGVEIYEYGPQVLHAKLLVIDDVVYVGSCNLDRRSLHINYELLVRLDWSELAAGARQVFATALDHSAQVRVVDWAAGRTWWQRVSSHAAYWLLSRVDPLLARRKFKALV